MFRVGQRVWCPQLPGVEADRYEGTVISVRSLPALSDWPAGQDVEVKWDDGHCNLIDTRAEHELLPIEEE